MHTAHGHPYETADRVSCHVAFSNRACSVTHAARSAVASPWTARRRSVCLGGMRVLAAATLASLRVGAFARRGHHVADGVGAAVCHPVAVIFTRSLPARERLGLAQRRCHSLQADSGVCVRRHHQWVRRFTEQPDHEGDEVPRHFRGTRPAALFSRGTSTHTPSPGPNAEHNAAEVLRRRPPAAARRCGLRRRACDTCVTGLCSDCAGAGVVL